MTRRYAVGILFAALFGLSVSPAAAHDKFRFIGTIVRYDAAKRIVTVKTNDKKLPPEAEIDITAKTRIERDGKKLTSAALKPGLYVVVDALGDDVFATEAVLVKVVPAPAAK